MGKQQSQAAGTMYPPLPWKNYYDVHHQLTTDLYTYSYYESNHGSPVPLTFVLLHGGGQSALSWACVAKFLRASNLRIIAYDMRCHGLTEPTATQNDTDDLSMAALVSEATAVLHALTQPEESLVLVGHSLGAALAAKLAAQQQQLAGNAQLHIAGVVMVDMVETTAIESTEQIANYLQSRPSAFPSVESAIEWSVMSKMIENLESARVSIPAQLVAVTEQQTVQYRWKTDLLRAQPHWQSWFTGLNDAFLSLRCARLLVIANTDRLDKAVMMSQMQGKLRVECIGRGVGHSLQEDRPLEVARLLMNFVQRHIAAAVPGAAKHMAQPSNGVQR